MFDRKTSACRSCLTVAAVVALLWSAGVAALGQQLYLEDFEDETLAGNAAIANGVISGGKLSLDDPATARGTFSVVQDFTDDVMTFSFDVVAPVTRGDGASMELVLRVGVGTTQGTLQSADQVVEAIVYRDGSRPPYVNNGNESVFLVANNNAAQTTFESPIDGTPVTLMGFQYIPYILNRETGIYGQLKGVTSYNMGQRPLQRLGIGSSSTAHVGTVSIDNVLVMSGATFQRDIVGKAPGDVDGDMDVDMDDFAAIRDHFQQSVTMRAEGDLNGDGTVDFADFRQWKSNFVAPPVAAGTAAVPEPMGAFVAVTAMLGLAACPRAWRRAA